MKDNIKEPVIIEREIEIVNSLFRHNLMMLRASETLSGKDLSLKLGLTKHRINDLEEGRMPPTFSDLIKIVDYFPITFNDLLEGKLELNIKSRNL
jgi:transcriptional regulator with XRE-family HTH domain